MKNLLTRLRQFFCRHRFDLDQLTLTGIPQPEKPAGAARFSTWMDYYARLSEHPANARRVQWPCVHCGKVFFAHCGLDITAKHGRLITTKIKNPPTS